MTALSSTLDKLMDVAESNVRGRGYHAVSFRDLADELGIKSSSVHHYFPRKEDLAVAVLQRYSDQFFEELDKETGNSTDPSVLLAAHTKVYRQSLLTTRKFCLCGMVAAESGGIPDSVSETAAEFFTKNIAWVQSALPTSMSPAERLRKGQHLVASMQGAMMLATNQQDFKLFDNIVRDIIESFDL
ncbi:MAG: TetR/AcrR family transcriptional regulator [Hyphomicrobiaceae bacterium]